MVHSLEKLREIEKRIDFALEAGNLGEWSRTFLRDMRVRIAKYGKNVRFSEKQAKSLSRLIDYDVAADPKEGPWLPRHVVDFGKARRTRKPKPFRRKRRWFGRYWIIRDAIIFLVFLRLLAYSIVPWSNFGFSLPGFLSSSNVAVSGVHFGMCGRPPHNNCVIDGDTFYYQRNSIRIANINTPETSSPECQYEAELGAQATLRLHELRNAGPFEIVASESRDEDRYRRKLRTVVRDGKSLGSVLVTEGLAHKWEGRKLSWCG